MSHILIVEDEPAVQAALQDTLTAYRVQSVSTVAEALRYLRTHDVDLLLLDLQLGAKSGMEVAHYVRQHTPYTAIVILTGHGNLQTAIQAIDLGAQAYLLKPVSPDRLETVVAEQLTRMRDRKQRDTLAQHMRAAVESVQSQSAQSSSKRLVSDKLVLDRERYEVTYDGQEIPFSPTQFRVLWVLVEADGGIVPPKEIAKEALGYAVSESEAAELVKGHISKIRRKLAHFYDDTESIRNVRNEGYMWTC